MGTVHCNERAVPEMAHRCSNMESKPLLFNSRPQPCSPRQPLKQPAASSFTTVLLCAQYQSPKETHTLTHTHTNTCPQLLTRTHTNRHIHTHTHTHSLTNTHTQTHALSFSHTFFSIFQHVLTSHTWSSFNHKQCSLFLCIFHVGFVNPHTHTHYCTHTL